jgi:hypothetical protein
MHDFFHDKAQRLAGAALVASSFLLGCGVPLDGDAGDTTQEDEQAILNGTPIPPGGSGYAMVETPEPGGFIDCSSTLLTNQWLLTNHSLHCKHNEIDTIVHMGAEARGIFELFDHPAYDISLVHLDQPFTVGSSTSGFSKPLNPFPPSDLLDKQLTCFGYGVNSTANTGAGTLRQGTVKVSRVGLTVTGDSGGENPAIEYQPVGDQLPWYGDSGSGCNRQTTNGMQLASVHKGAADPELLGYGIPTSEILPWVMRTMYPKRPLVCHGPFCMTTGSRFAAEAAVNWRPCGSRPWTFEMQYTPTNAKVFVNGTLMHLRGRTIKATLAAGKTAKIVVQPSFLSRAQVDWARARCQ